MTGVTTSCFSPSVDDLRGLIDDELGRLLTERRGVAPEASDLVDEIERVIAAGGKRLRPAFCYWGYRSWRSRHDPAVLTVAASLELLHTFAIVHDDIMDGSLQRRSVPTSHALHGIPVALLVGDLALVLADDTFMSAGLAPEIAARAFEAYSRMRQEVIAGQYLDLACARDPSTTEAQARRVAVLKSGRYSVEEPLAIGAALAGAPARVTAALSRFGEPLGEAFQLRDDLLGTFGEQQSTGKPVDSDIREGKHHVLYAKTIAALGPQEREEFVCLWGAGDGLTDGDLERVRALIEASGARGATERLLGQLVATARRNLRAAPVQADARAALAELAEEATNRLV